MAVKYGKRWNAMAQWKNAAVLANDWSPLPDYCNVRFCSSSMISTQIRVIVIRFFFLHFFSAFTGTNRGSFHLKLVSFEAHENHISHETKGLSHRHLVVRRGKPFKVTLLFGGRAWNPHTEALSLQVWLGTSPQAVCIWSNLLLTQWSGSIQAFHLFLTFTIIKYSHIGWNFDPEFCSHPKGDMSEWVPLWLSNNPPNPHVWSAKVNPGGGSGHSQSIAVHICSPVLSSVGLYHLLLHTETFQSRRTYTLGSFVLLFNPWLKGGPQTPSLLSARLIPHWCSSAFQMIQCTCLWMSRETSMSRATMGWYIWAAIRISVGDPGYMVR